MPMTYEMWTCEGDFEDGGCCGVFGGVEGDFFEDFEEGFAVGLFEGGVGW